VAIPGCCLAPFASAQATRPTDVPIVADAELAAFEAAVAPRDVSVPAGPSDADLTRARAELATEYVRQADQLRAYRQRAGNEARASDARRLEALALVQATRLGDDAQRERLDLLVDAVRSDPDIDATRRFEVAAYADNLVVELNDRLDASTRLEEYARVARALQAEFPDVEAGYEALLAVARAQPPKEGAALANGLLQMPEASGEIRLAASEHVRRCALVGQSISELTAPAEGETSVDLDFAAGRRMVLYTWSAGDAYSLWVAQQVAEQAPADVAVIAIDLGHGSGGAEAVGPPDLPGTRLDGLDPAVAQMCWVLRLTEPGLVYVTDPDGVITAIGAQNDLSRHLNSGEGR
jgi:hypothetical protein